MGQATQIKIDFQNVSRMNRCSYDVASQNHFLMLTGLSRKTLFRYRQLALKAIPDYEDVSDRWYEYRFGDSFVAARVKALSRGLIPPKNIDRPPFCRKQLEILNSVAAMFKQGMRAEEFTELHQVNPNHWRKYYVHSNHN